MQFYRFVYSTFAGGILYADSAGCVVYDITGDKVISATPTADSTRLFRAKRLLQQSYSFLDSL